MEPVFDMDDEVYYVDVVCLQREFSLPLADSAGTTLDGVMHWHSPGSYCHYTMTVRARPGRENELNLLWEHVLQPGLHMCHFPYNDAAINQAMYVTGGKQALVRCQAEDRRWGDLTLHFIAAEPRRTP